MLDNGKIIQQSAISTLTVNGNLPSSNKDWRVEAFGKIIQCIGGESFPCLFARNAWRKESLQFSFIGENDTVSDMIDAMTHYTETIANTKPEERLYSPLLLVFQQNEFHNLQDEHAFAWLRIQEMHDNDLSPWPDSVPAEAEDSEWSFCFGGVELFINVSCPNHTQLKSRSLGDHIVFVINPREHFDILASHKAPKGVKIREKIRNRVSHYNEGYVPSELGFYGEEDNLEWKQYILSEHDSKSASRCPLHIKKEAYSS